jgi:uncharacterized membrane protein YkvA (DUF1232 family)
MQQRAAVSVGYAKALVRYFRDGEASLFGKLFVVLSVAYVVMPLDAIPDFVPVVGWLDDVGVGAIALAFLGSVLGKYRAGSADVLDGAAPILVRARRRG